MWWMRGALVVAPILAMTACGGGKPPVMEAPQPPRASGYPQPGHLVPLFALNNTRLSQTADLMLRTGNKQEKNAAGARLVQLADGLATAAWRESQRPMIARMRARSSPLTRSDEERQLDEWQKRYMVRVYDAMRILGGEPVLAHCRAVTKDAMRPNAQHKLALSVLSAHDETRPARGSGWSMPSQGLGVASGGARAYQLPKSRFDDPAKSTAPPAAEAPRVEGGTIINVNEVVSSLWPYFYVCYRRAYRKDGRFGAWVILNARVSGDGSVASVDSKGDESIPIGMMNCLKQVAKQARFAPPQGDPTVFIPLSFVPDPRWDAPAPTQAPTTPVPTTPPSRNPPSAVPPPGVQPLPVAPPAGPPAAPRQPVSRQPATAPPTGPGAPITR